MDVFGANQFRHGICGGYSQPHIVIARRIVHPGGIGICCIHGSVIIKIPLPQYNGIPLRHDGQIGKIHRKGNGTFPDIGIEVNLKHIGLIGTVGKKITSLVVFATGGSIHTNCKLQIVVTGIVLPNIGIGQTYGVFGAVMKVDFRV